MDLKIAGAPVTDAERQVIAATVPQASVVEVAGRVVRAGHAARSMRHHLLPALAAVQAEFGWISPGALDEICTRLQIPPAEAYGVATFYGLLSTEPAPPRVAHVCDDIGCAAFGGDDLMATLREHVGDEAMAGDGFAWRPSPCLGQCDRRPAAFVQRAGTDDVVVVAANTEAVLAAADAPHVVPDAQTGTTAVSIGPARLLRRAGTIDPLDLGAFRQADGYAALEAALSMGPDGVINAVTEANLKGRGGAAFPTGVKWRAVADGPAPRYLICNADESEPGTFKDRVLMEADPFALVEAMTIAGTAVGADKGYLYLRGEYAVAAERMRRAIDMAREAGLVGEDILGSGVGFEIEIRRGQGAYICGEETALMESIEGFRGEPRNKPPFPTTHGLFGRPTVVNNVETLLNIAHIIVDGPDAFRAVGTQESAGTRLFCLSGGVARPGTYEAPFGVTLRAVIDAAGGATDGIQAVLLGGAAGSFVLADDLDLPLTFEDTRARGMSLGSGVIMVFGASIAMGAIVARIAAFFRDETCGQCVPCRIGVVRQEESLARYLAAEPNTYAVSRERAILADLDQVMTDASICGLGQTAASAVRSAIRLGLV